MGGFSYAVDNDRKFRDALQKAKEVTTDLRIPLALIALDFYKSQKAIFGLKGPGQYQDLAESTKKDKADSGFPIYPILVRSGALKDAASVQGAKGNITQLIGTSQMRLGVDGSVIPYAIYHQSDAARKKIPLRKFIFIGPEAKRFATSDQIGRLERWMGILESYQKQVLEQRNLGVVR